MLVKENIEFIYEVDTEVLAILMQAMLLLKLILITFLCGMEQTN